MPELTMGSLFDGIGGFPLAAVRNGITPVWASEIEPFPIEVTKTHFPDMVHVGDITKLNGADLPPVDIICGGSPCQELSQIGNITGLTGEKSGLFYQAIRIIDEMMNASGNRFPAIAVWENVIGARLSGNRLDYLAVLRSFAGEHGCFTGKFRFQRRTGIDRVRHGAHHLRVPTEADRPKVLFLPIRFENDRVRIRAKTDLLLGIVVADWHESAFLWHS